MLTGARSYFLAIQTYKKIYVQSYQDKAWKYMHILTSTFPTTYFGKLEKKDLARGFTEHYFANAELCPTPLPTETPGPAQGKRAPTAGVKAKIYYWWKASPKLARAAASTAS